MNKNIKDLEEKIKSMKTEKENLIDYLIENCHEYRRIYIQRENLKKKLMVLRKKGNW